MAVVGQGVVGGIDTDPAEIGEQELRPGVARSIWRLLARCAFAMEVA